MMKLIFNGFWKILLGSGIGVLLPAQVVFAQAPASESVTDILRIVSAGEARFSMDIYGMLVNMRFPVSQPHYPKDSIRQAMAQRAQHWLIRVQNGIPLQGLQYDHLGALAVMADQDSLAQSYFGKRLNSPKISIQDKAWSLRTAVVAFADIDRPDRMRLAAQYATMLDSLPDEANLRKFQAHATLAGMYRRRGHVDETIEHALKAFAAVKGMQFRHRRAVWQSGLYVDLAVVLSGRPNGRQMLDSLNAYLRPLAVPSLDVIEEDSIYVVMGNMFENSLDYHIRTAGKIGKQASSLIAHYWFNTPASTDPSTAVAIPFPDTLSLRDGVVRLIEFGELGCAPCMRALPAMDRLNDRFRSKGVEVWYVTKTSGYWDVGFVSREEEAGKLRKEYLERRKHRGPIALWAGEKQPTDDGGMLPEESPNVRDFEVRATPTFYIVDGNGRVRFIARGYGRAAETEQQLSDVLEYLIVEAERKHENITKVSASTLLSSEGR